MRTLPRFAARTINRADRPGGSDAGSAGSFPARSTDLIVRVLSELMGALFVPHDQPA
jgi:hypothetical protein